jgi:ATP-dependent helicase YprA (DUF1998 family)
MTTPHAASPFVTIDHVRRRAASAAVSWSALASEPLRAHLLETLAERGGRHSFMADPVVEVTSTWGAARETLSSLSGRLLQPELVSALEGAGVPDPEGRKRYRFKGDQRPFTHQLEAWERLLDDDPQSVLVTSGTGSGKTECFLVPILNRLARASAQGLPRLSGVRALVIYPLNALINSQRERLSDWTSPFKGKIRFCLYNGETPDKLRLSERNARPEEIRDRETLRNEPPQILVTNITMLEYMLIRSKDRPILDASQGKLEFIVLDEAHTYVGSQAAELALLLRRVTQAFGVDPGKVRFVATSATIGGEGDAGTRGALRRFLADIGGVPESRVHVIEGSRVVPPLPEPQPGLELPTPSELAEMDGQARYGRLAACPQFRKAYDALRPRPASVSEWAERLGVGTDACERLLEAAAGARADVDVAGRRETHALLPLRIHAFHRTEPGIFVCINPSCRGRAGTKLDHAAWRYGAVFHERIERCPDCQSLILELKLCSNCGNETLTGERITNHDAAEEVRLPSVSAVDDEFEQGLVDDEQQPPDGGQEDANETDEVEDDDGPAKASVLLTASGHGKPCAIHRTTGKVMGTMGAEAVLLQAADEVICPSCSATLAGRGNARLYSFRLGAPFLLGNIIPELLEDASESDTIRQGSAPRFRPADGKQLLTFTDSRQGTARLSAKLQAEAERNYVRAFIYHAVQNAAGGGGNADELERLDRDIAEIKAQLEQAPILKRLLDQKLAERERLTRPQGIAWSKMVDALSSDRTVRYIREKIWLDRDNRQFHGDPQFAKFLLLRELFRRPRRANSVETLGLACLTAPAIETQTEIGVPRELKDHGGTLDDWKAFLAVALTWYVRANSIVMVPRELKRFIHRRIPTRCLIGPQAERKDAILQRQWPRQVSQDWRLPAFVRLLMQGLKLNLADPGHRADAEAILLKAWNALYPGLQSGNDGYQLAYDKLNLMALESAWLCPVTNRVLDRSFRRLTPYPAIAGSSSDAEFRTVTPIELPRLPFPFGQAGGREATPDEIEAWLRDDARVVAGRARGTWGDLHDAVARRGNFFRAAEHSAQQPGWRLREYEKEFRQGLINVLNCSTTMEMGVDIGSIGTVAMTNVPESLASYRQRIGRAGRSGQAMSLGFTLCKDRPLDAAVFRQPIKMLERAMHAPAVRLDSPVIVQRHVNALLLGAFLHGRGEELHQLKAGPFFGCERAKGTEPGDACASRLLVDWVARPATRKAMELPLNALLARTCLEGRLDRVVEEARAAMSAGETLFRQVWAPLNLNLSELEQTARKAIELQQGRLERTFVLAELAAHGFLPAYGFPTDVVEFDNSGPWTPAHPRRGGGEIEPGAQPEGGSTRFAPRSMPSRSLDLAIRDYAPGTEVVLDGLVYRSAGVSLAWRRPASAEGLEHIEALGWMWRCQVCGAVGTAVLKPDHCPSCNTEQPPQATKTLKPAGFSCDPSDPPHDEVEQIDYIPPRSPLVSARTGAWVALHDAAVGRFRKSSSGQVIYHTMGAHGCGYAVCLQCGRAAPESSEDPSSPPPQGMVPHRALRTWKKGADGRCDGADRTYSIQRHRALAHEITTDVFELQLFDLPAEEEGRGLALPIGFAVREALARWWGIETAEVGVSVAQSRRDDGAKTWSIILYDRASGGAGFAPTAAEAIDVLLKDAADILDCRNGYSCRSGCPDCILTRDAEVYSAGIDRPVALDLLRTKVLPRLHVPEADRRLGNGATVELEPLEDVITALASRSAKAALTIWLPGNIWELDIARWPAVPLARRLALHGVGVRFVLTGTDVPADQDKRMRLLSLLQTTGAELASARPLGIASGFRPLAHLSSGPGMLWAVRDTGDGAGDLENPWRPGANVLRCASSAPDASPIALSALALRSDPSLVQVDISSEIDGALNGFGERFWTQIHGKTPLIADLARAEPLQTIGYTDRYLKSPLVVRLIYEILKAAPGLSRSTTTLRLSTAGNTRGLNGSYPSKLFHDWAREADRQSVVRSLMGQVAETSSVVFGQRGDLSHARVLSLAYAKSTVRIYLDQGVGFWRMNASELFDFTRDAAIQAQKLMQATTPVSGDGNKPMPVWLRRN